MNFIIHARNFRGFSSLDIPFCDVNFLTGGNSSGKTSIIYLLELVLSPGFRKEANIFTSRKIINSNDIISPYLKDNYPISFGYFFESQDEASKGMDGIIIECARKPKNSIITKKLSVTNGTLAAYIRRGKESFMQRFDRNVEGKINFESFLAAHQQQTKKGFRRSKLQLPNGASEFMLQAIDIDEEDRSLDTQLLRQTPILYPLVFGPIRKEPKHYYDAVRLDFDEAGSHTPLLLQKLQTDQRVKRSSRVFSKIVKFGKRSGLFDDLTVKKVDPSDLRSPYKIEIIQSGKVFSLDEVGYGISQILPIIVEIYFAAASKGRNRIIAVQQPEVHLHPVAQAEFGELLHEMGEEGVMFLIETHSDYIIDRYRYSKMKRGGDTTGQILYAENSKEGNTISRIGIDSGGRLLDTPKGYRDFFMREQIKMMETI